MTTGKAAATRFWEQKSLDEMTKSEWESLCDGCGQCCLQKLEDADTGEIHYTQLSCELLDPNTCLCVDYANRLDRVPDCVAVDTLTESLFAWLPKSCAYRRLAEGRPLAEWHPLISGDKNTVHEAGVSAQGRVIASNTVFQDDWVEHVITWVEF